MTQDFAGSEKAIKGVTDMRDSGPAIASTYLTLAQKSYEALLKDTQAAPPRPSWTAPARKWPMPATPPGPGNWLWGRRPGCP